METLENACITQDLLEKAKKHSPVEHKPTDKEASMEQ